MSETICKKCNQPIYGADGHIFATNPPTFAHLKCPDMSETKENLCPECGCLVTNHVHESDSPCLTLCFGKNMACPCARTYESLAGEYKGKGQTYLMGKQTDNSIRCICQTWTGRADWVEGHHPNCDGSWNIVTPPESAKYEQVAGMMIPKSTAAGVDEPELSGDAFIRDQCEKMYQAGIGVAKSEPSLQLLVIDLGEDSCVVKVENGLPDSRKFSFQCEMVEHEFWHGDVDVVHHSFTALRSAIDGEKPVPRIEEESGGGWHLRFDVGGTQTTYIGPIARAALESLFKQSLPIWTGGKWEWINEDDFLTNRLVKVWRYTR